MYLVLLILLLIALLTTALASLSLAPWVPTRKKDLPRILKLANLQVDEIFYDLGCGSGKVAIYLAKNSRSKVIGLELALPFYLLCKFRQFFTRNKNLIFKYKNLFKEDLSQANVIYFFAASADKLKRKSKLIQKLKQELKPGSKIISYVFPIEDWQPLMIDKPSKKDIAIYLYQI